MEGWPHHGLEHDLRPRMADMVEAGRPFALATVYRADGGPRGVGAQMVITDQESWGFVSGGCIEADVALHGRATLHDNTPRRLTYGEGSPWVDIRLPCGGRLDLLVERIEPDDPAINALIGAYRRREAVRYRTDGARRRCSAQAEPGPWIFDEAVEPAQRLIVIGSDPIALAIAAMGARLGWQSVVVWPGGPLDAPGLGITHRRDEPAAALQALHPDAFTAVAVATHEASLDDSAIAAALSSPAGYIGVLGARRRIPDRLDRLRARGFSEDDTRRLHMPIGLPVGAATPWEIAVSVTAEIIAERRAA